jgi:hypothetical protein
VENGLVVIEQTGLATWIRESGVLYGYPLILFLHTLGLSTLVGLNSAINFRLLGFAPRIPLAALDRLFVLMWGGLALTATTGVLLFISDATKHASNPAFWVKLVFVALSVTILGAMRKRNSKLLAGVSLACWFGALSAGRLMAYIAEFVS